MGFLYGTKGEIVVAHDCLKRKKLICGTKGEIVVAHGSLKRKKNNMWHKREKSGGSWPPAFPCYLDKQVNIQKIIFSNYVLVKVRMTNIINNESYNITYSLSQFQCKLLIYYIDVPVTVLKCSFNVASMFH